MIIQGCILNKNASELSFVNKYGGEDFSIFKGMSFTLRGLDNNGNKIIFAYDTLACGYLKIVVHKDSFTVVDTQQMPLKDGCIIIVDPTKISLSQAFAKYNIYYIAANKNNNVFFKTKPFEGKPNLLLLNDSTNVEGLNLEKWEQLKGRWFLLKE